MKKIVDLIEATTNRQIVLTDALLEEAATCYLEKEKERFPTFETFLAHYVWEISKCLRK